MRQNLAGTAHAFSVQQTGEIIEQTGEILEDRSASGRERPWRVKKLHADLVGGAYLRLGKENKAARCLSCGSGLAFNECPQDGYKRLKSANFCRERLCPMCAWRRSLKWASDVSKVLHAAVEEEPGRQWVMLTLTQRNVPSEALPGEITKILHGWRLLTQRQDLRPVAGWLRTLEVTRNDRTGEWHPHIHALLWVKPEYWSGQSYVSQKRWRELWAEVMGLDYDPSVEVHRVRPRKAKSSDSSESHDHLDAAAFEVGKYTVKDADLVGDGSDTTERVEVLDAALKSRRLLAWGGRLKAVAREVAPEVPEGADDLVHITDEDHGMQCPICSSKMRTHVYRWIQSMRSYVG
jgi:plasmid rolling circle replication initiator protein Rep